MTDASLSFRDEQRHGTFCGTTILVAGYGTAGRSAVRALLAAHAIVSLTTDGPVELEDDVDAGKIELLGPLVRVPQNSEADGFDLTDAVVVSPGYRPTHPLVASAAGDDVAVWGELELAWRLRGDPERFDDLPRRTRSNLPDHSQGSGGAPWLVLTGTNGKTTTVRMLESILRADGLQAAAVGNVGVPLIDAVVSGGYDVLAVEASSQQLHFAPSIRPAAAALLNLAPDHLDWHGSYEAYVADKIGVWRGADVAIGNLDDPVVAAALPAGGVGFTLGDPAPGQLGVRDGLLVCEAFGDDAVPLLPVSAVRPAGAHNVANALAAAALARAFGVGAHAIGDGLRAFVPDPHRNQSVLVRDGVEWVDDSKATNPHAAAASLAAYPRIVWVAGGQLKGVDVDPLVASVATRLAGAVLLGRDRDLIATALARHAPDVPVITVESTDDGAMTEVVRAAAGLARPGDTVLLAPAAASYDMFAGYGARGDAFAAAARAAGTGRA